jgi:prevent-host-death family protein
MSSHSVAEAKERFPELVELALRGEPVVITRDGPPVAELRPVPPAAAKTVTPEGMAWLRAHRIQPSRPQSVDATALIRQMRDED